jgi:hypothetical protein
MRRANPNIVWPSRSSSPTMIEAAWEVSRFDDEDGNLLFEAGPHPALHGDFAALCAALGA